MDTNVAIVANGRPTNAGPKCRLAAVDALSDLVENGRIAIDAAGEMLAEYRPHLNSKGQPGVGDRFMFLVVQNYDGKVDRIALGKAPNSSFSTFQAIRPSPNSIHRTGNSRRRHARRRRPS
ncbi:MAG: hypothetical protein EXQ87_12000 [Alphaproteobacteria bacterium]|nr:hypothetical protein [Alphaproteobacteria bacterium]